MTHFIERTDEEIVARIAKLESSGTDWLGTERSDLIMRLPFNTAKPFLKDDAKEEEWEQLPRDRNSVLKEALEYMPFAWDKANGCRGLSAGRSLNHYSAWAWLVKEDFGDLSDYEFYGKPQLVEICNRFGWDSSKWDDGIRSNTGD